MSNNKLFNDFQPVSAKAWKQKIQADLEGMDYEETLVWESPEGIKVLPFYHHEDTVELKNTVEPNSPTSKTAKSWEIGHTIVVDNAFNANAKALKFLEKGVEAILFMVPTEEVEIKILLKGIDIERVPIYFELQFLSADYVEKVAGIAKKAGKNVYFNIDILGNLARTGNWFGGQEKDHENLGAILKSEHLNVLQVDMSLYQNSGANMVQQLAYALAHANEYLNHFADTEASAVTNASGNTNSGQDVKSTQNIDLSADANAETHTNANTNGNPNTDLDANDNAKANAAKSERTPSFQICFKVSVGTNYFFEIAKLRALRLLWKTLGSEYGITTDCHIMAHPTKRNKTLYDYNINMLRTTTESMAAVLGGADVIFNMPYDAIYHEINAFGERIAINQLLLLKNESYFDKVGNPADGAYYIENLTHKLAEEALELFKDIEKKGGFLAHLKSGVIQLNIRESAEKEQERFDAGKEVLVGTNKYQNPNDRMKDDLELNPFAKSGAGETLIEPIVEKRLAETVEQKRLEDE
ncbi:MAG: methylmalonyl-CoA mutase subunit beta [Pricia sp.]